MYKHRNVVAMSGAGNICMEQTTFDQQMQRYRTQGILLATGIGVPVVILVGYFVFRAAKKRR